MCGASHLLGDRWGLPEEGGGGRAPEEEGGKGVCLAG